MKSDRSKDWPVKFKGGDSSIGHPKKKKRSHSPTLSCVSMKSDRSKDWPVKFKGGDSSTGQFQPGPVDVEVQQIHKSHLRKKFQCLIEGITQQGDTRLLQEIYTELYITEGGGGEVSDEHEVRQIERASWRKAAQGRSIKSNDIFKPLSGQDKVIRCCDVTEPASMDVLLTNLIKGNLLPSALLWITTRPAAANQIPSECVDQVTEIKGFNDPQKEEYFRRQISDENLASRTITHLKSSRSLYIMCHIPVFCWISATVVVRTSEESESLQMPRTLTQMYTHFLIIQTNMKKYKYTERNESDEELIFKLGKLAFHQLEKGNLIFYVKDLRECGIDVTEASVYSGVCTQIFREESGLYQGKVFSFVHLSVQEFLGASYVFLCFSNRQRNMPDQQQTPQRNMPDQQQTPQRNMPDQQQTPQLSALFRDATLHDLHKTAVDLALQSKNGHLDLFLRFLLGLSLESNQILLKHMLPLSSSQSDSSEPTVQYIKQKIRDQSSSDRRINLFYCLNELNHHAIVEEKRSSGTLGVDMLLPGEWEIKRFELKMSEEQLAEFDLQKYIKTPEKDQTELLSPDDVLQRLVPVVTTSTLAELIRCKLTEKSCSYLASALTAHSSSLRLLDLSYNVLLDSGVELLCSALCSANWRN
ncbi:protein NLRC3-like [Alosa pseudoharengus]|uniref:protein NLRC3-like n=1 Tax=Alosa pseudoharengus TaxID=34774 RepID=UPI003F8A1C99